MTARHYIRETSGRHARWRWLSVWFTQIVFYGLPWLTLHGRPLLQLNLERQCFYLFGAVLWPQEFIYLALLLILVLGLQMFSTTLVGRIWCGFGCPHTIYSELFLWMERKIEGTRGARIRLDQAPWSLRKLALKGAKHGAWLALALWTGISFVAYLTPVRELLADLVHARAPAWQLLWIVLYGGLTYAGAGILREQMCRSICPHGRLQATLFDRDTLVVSYDAARGEPRGLRNRKTAALHAAMGDCVDCTLCIQVCPTGADIRKGMHADCMGCGACIDACDGVMDKLGAPRGLIRFATLRQIPVAVQGAPAPSRPAPAPRLARLRVLLYGSGLALLAGGVGLALALRTPLDMTIVRDRAPGGAPPAAASEGETANVYRLDIANTDERAHRYRITANGLDGLHLATPAIFTLEAGSARLVPLRLQAAAAPGSHRIAVRVQALDDARILTTQAAAFVVLAQKP